MYTTLPLLVSVACLTYGVSVLSFHGRDRLSILLFAVYGTSALWLLGWSLLFQSSVQGGMWTDLLSKVSYLPALLIPALWYHLTVVMVRVPTESKWVGISYGVCAGFIGMQLTTQGVTAEHYLYFFGAYPKAGVIHPLFVVSSLIVWGRCMLLAFRGQQMLRGEARVRQRLLLGALALQGGVMLDVLPCYGVGLFPPGGVFLACSVCLLAQIRRNSIDPLAVAATVAHEMRTPWPTGCAFRARR